eukprot:3873127-Rhodomonas_salina.1
MRHNPERTHRVAETQTGLSSNLVARFVCRSLCLDTREYVSVGTFAAPCAADTTKCRNRKHTVRIEIHSTTL